MKQIIAAILLFCTVAFAQQAAVPIALTEAETREAVAAKTAVEQAEALWKGVGQIVLNADVEDCARPAIVVALAQIRQLRLQLAQSQQALVLERQRNAHGCGNCEWSPDYKSLVRPK